MEMRKVGERWCVGGGRREEFCGWTKSRIVV